MRLFILVFIVSLSTTPIASAAEDYWQISISGGSGIADDPSAESDEDIDIEAGGVFHLVANLYDRQNDDGANLYYQFFYGSNTLDTEVNAGTNAAYETELEAHHLQIGGVYEWRPEKRFRPYFAAAVGASHYIPEQTSDETYLSSSAALGANLWFTNTLALKFEARAIGTVFNSSSSIFCNEDDCSLGIDGSLWWQQHLSAGVTWQF